MGSKDEKHTGFKTPIPVSGELPLSKIEFQRLTDVPPEAEWFANLTNENTKRAYREDVTSFMRFVGIKRPEDFRTVVRAHVIAWRKTLEKRKLAPASVRRKLSALSDLYDYLCEKNAVADNPVHGVERPKEGANQGKTPALSDAQAAALLEAPARGHAQGEARPRNFSRISLSRSPACRAVRLAGEGLQSVNTTGTPLNRRRSPSATSR